MDAKILALTKRLMTIKSTKDKPENLNRVLEIAQKELANFNVKRFESSGIPSLLFYNTESLPEKFKIILNSHLDVVPGESELFRPKIIGGKLSGRGAYDMKAAAAVQILVFKELAKKLNYPFGLQLVTDEEVGGVNGTAFQLGKGIKADFVIAGEPTNFEINNLAKGILWVKLKTKGKSAHGAMPWEGDNALTKLIRNLNKLIEKEKTPKKEVWKTTYNLSWIKTTNETNNKVPQDAQATIDIRYIPEDKGKVLPVLKKLLSKEVEIEVLQNQPPAKTKASNRYIKSLMNSVKKVTGRNAKTCVKHFASDVRMFTSKGMNGVTFGPIGEGLHTQSEWVDIKSLSAYYKILQDFLYTLSNRENHY